MTSANVSLNSLLPRVLRRYRLATKAGSANEPDIVEAPADSITVFVGYRDTYEGYDAALARTLLADGFTLEGNQPACFYQPPGKPLALVDGRSRTTRLQSSEARARLPPEKRLIKGWLIVQELEDEELKAISRELNWRQAARPNTWREVVEWVSDMLGGGRHAQLARQRVLEAEGALPGGMRAPGVEPLTAEELQEAWLCTIREPGLNGRAVTLSAGVWGRTRYLVQHLPKEGPVRAALLAAYGKLWLSTQPSSPYGGACLLPHAMFLCGGAVESFKQAAAQEPAALAAWVAKTSAGTPTKGEDALRSMREAAASAGAPPGPAAPPPAAPPCLYR